MADISYTNPFTLTTQAPGASAPAGGAPNMQALLQWAIANRQAQEAQAQAERQRAADLAALQTVSGISEAAARRPQPVQMMRDPQETPTFLKMVNIAGSTGGYVPAQSWEPGAVASGSVPAGHKPFSPSSASTGGFLPPSEAGLGRSAAGFKDYQQSAGGYVPADELDQQQADVSLDRYRAQQERFQDRQRTQHESDQREEDMRRARLGLLTGGR